MEKHPERTDIASHRAGALHRDRGTAKAAARKPNPGQARVAHCGRSGRSTSRTSVHSFGTDSKRLVASRMTKGALADMAIAPE